MGGLLLAGESQVGGDGSLPANARAVVSDLCGVGGSMLDFAIRMN